MSKRSRHSSLTISYHDVLLMHDVRHFLLEFNEVTGQRILTDRSGGNRSIRLGHGRRLNHGRNDSFVTSYEHRSSVPRRHLLSNSRLSSAGVSLTAHYREIVMFLKLVNDYDYLS